MKHNTLVTQITLIAFCLLMSSCSTNKAISNSEPEQDMQIENLKSSLKFSTHLSEDQIIQVKASNISSTPISLDKLLVFISPLSSKSYKSYTLHDLGVNKIVLESGEKMKLEIPFKEKISSDFGNKEDNYSISIIYNSKKPLDSSDKKTIYYISNQYDAR